MNKQKLIQRLIVAPFVLVLLVVTYTFQLFKHWIGYVRYGGEFITYSKDDPKRLNDIFYLLKEKL